MTNGNFGIVTTISNRSENRFSWVKPFEYVTIADAISVDLLMNENAKPNLVNNLSLTKIILLELRVSISNFLSEKIVTISRPEENQERERHVIKWNSLHCGLDIHPKIWGRSLWF
jgi:hypothetical protein